MIKEAAIKDSAGNIHTGRRHNEIINSHPRGYFRGCSQGFITADGEFVTREEAAQIAFDCGQIKIRKQMLFSEDLW